MHFKSHIFLATSLLIKSTLLALKVEVYFQFDEASKKQELTLTKQSELFLAKSTTYNSIFSIKSQALQDAESIENTLKSQGFLEAKVEVYVDPSADPPSAIFNIHANERFYFKTLELTPRLEIPLPKIQGFVASYSLIEEVEKNLLETLHNQGYFFAKIHKTKIVITEASSADLLMSLQVGEKVFFGPVSIEGCRKVDPQLIQKKIPWKEGNLFNASLLKQLQKNLLDTELFSQVTVEPLSAEEGRVPIRIEVSEAKFKTLSVGVSYQTHFGAGGDLAFEHRNLWDKGQKLKLETSVTQNSVLGLIEYKIPSLYQDNQAMIWKIEATRESLQPSFSDNLYEVGARFEKGISQYWNYTASFVSRYYQVQHSVMNGTFALASPSFMLFYDTTGRNLNPKRGIKSMLGAHYYQNLNRKEPSLQSSFKIATYLSFLRNKVTWAQQLYLSSFFLSDRDAIPVPLRFFGGTDEFLRGFKYYTVSPLEGHKPQGGKSALFINTELRFPIHTPLGGVLFYDSGFVSSTTLAPKQSPYYQSIGFGIRYFSLVGPLRIDIGFPLNPRKNLDPKFKILASFGHTF